MNQRSNHCIPRKHQCSLIFRGDAQTVWNNSQVSKELPAKRSTLEPSDGKRTALEPSDGKRTALEPSDSKRTTLEPSDVQRTAM